MSLLRTSGGVQRTILDRIDWSVAPGEHWGIVGPNGAGKTTLLRIASAQMVLDSRGFESNAAVGNLPEGEQRVVVVSILQRELGVMVLAALVILVLLIRAAGTGG